MGSDIIPNGKWITVSKLIEVIQRLGFPMVVAIFFMLAFVGLVPSPLSERLEQLVRTNEAHQVDMARISLQVEATRREEIRILRAICRKLGGEKDCD